MPRLRNSVSIEMPVMMPGKAMGSSTSLRNTALPGKASRSSAKAAGTPMASVRAVEAVATISELAAASMSWSFSARRRYHSSVSPSIGQESEREALNE